MPRIIRSAQSKRDTAEIWVHIAEDNFDAADRLIHTIDSKLNLLAENPLAGRAREELSAGLRSFPVGDYLIFYTPVEDGIELVRVIHGARNLEHIFKP